ncbi:hypothetical protein B0T20DRAFT_169904 [Sordaria brevicollis]|uniref:Uncharacterized protein n=1 Tax=Sordaria brevicollis TaxID=83679 RepID=A0AAE0PGZ9_SORBR|nr:hypothetical protein B0T20DRAFT_169904 [Sordaria brevicollis]
MPLKNSLLRLTTTPEDDLIHTFDQARLDRLAASMQPLLTRNVTEEELEALLKEAEDCLKEVTITDTTDIGKSGKASKRFQGWSWMRSNKVKRAKTTDIKVEGV